MIGDQEPLPFTTMQPIIEAGLSASLAELYAEFDHAAIASRQRAQVYTARMHTGERVVVKALRPDGAAGIADHVSSLHDLHDQYRRLTSGKTGFATFDPEFAKQSEKFHEQQLDLRREAENLSAYRAAWCNESRLLIPRIFENHSSAQVLTMERMDALPMGQNVLKARDVNARKLAGFVFSTFTRQAMSGKIYHADIHGGNVLLDRASARTSSPRLVLLDFGRVAQLSDRDRALFPEFHQAHEAGDTQRALALMSHGLACFKQAMLAAERLAREIDPRFSVASHLSKAA
jgi:ubiquinone biosynthesis protein